MKLPSPSSAEAVVSVRELTRRYGTHLVLDDVSLYVPRGSVFGLVGENGAGKTTLIKHILGQLKPENGSVRVFGLDPAADPVGVLRRLGYLSEQRDLPGWMRVDELLRYLQAFYPAWDPQYAEALRQEFDLDPQARIKTLSQGQLAKTGLLAALAFRPELLVLDEPSSGLDPVVRRDILEAIIQTVAEEGRTVFFSSHLLDEIERVSDYVVMLHQGQVLVNGAVDLVKANHRQFVVRFERPLTELPRLSGGWLISGQGVEWRLIGSDPSYLAGEAQRLGGRIVDEQCLSLDDIFVARLGWSVAGTLPA